MVSMEAQSATTMLSAATHETTGMGASTTSTASTTPTASHDGDAAAKSALEDMVADAMQNQRLMPSTSLATTENNNTALLGNSAQTSSATSSQSVPNMRVLGVNKGLVGTASAASDMLLMKELASRAKFSHPSKPKKAKNQSEKRAMPIQQHTTDVVVPAPRVHENKKQTKQLSRVSTPDADLSLTEDEATKARRSLLKSSGYRGVSKCAKDGRWQARIRIGRVVKYLGRFRTEPEAAKCYDEAARKFHGSRAVVNFGDAPLEIGEKVSSANAKPNTKPVVATAVAGSSSSNTLPTAVSTSTMSAFGQAAISGASKRERQAEARSMVDKVAAARAAVIAAAGQHIPRRRSSSAGSKNGLSKTKNSTSYPKHPVKLAAKPTSAAASAKGVQAKGKGVTTKGTKAKTKRRVRKNSKPSNQASTSATSALSALLSHPALPPRTLQTYMTQTQQQQANNGGLTPAEQQQRQHHLLLANMYGSGGRMSGVSGAMTCVTHPSSNHIAGTPYDLPMTSLLQHHLNTQQQRQQVAAMHAYTNMYMQQQQQQRPPLNGHQHQPHPHLPLPLRPTPPSMLFSSNAEQAAFLAAATVAANAQLNPQQQQQLASMLLAQHAQKGQQQQQQQQGHGIGLPAAVSSASASSSSSPPLPPRHLPFPASLFNGASTGGGLPVVPVSLASSSSIVAQEGQTGTGKTVKKSKKRKSDVVAKSKVSGNKKKKKKIGLKQAAAAKSTKAKKSDKGKVKATVDPASLDEAARGLIFLMQRPE